MRLIDAEKLETAISESFQKHYGDSHSQQLHDFYRSVVKKIRSAERIQKEEN